MRIKNGNTSYFKKAVNRIRRHLPVQKSRKRVGDRKVISGVLWEIRAGSALRQLPEFFGKWTTIHSRFKRWSKAGIFEKIFKIFAKRVNKQCHAMMDSAYVKAHRAASICACKDKDRKIGTSGGEKTTKIHILRNEAGIPFEFIIIGGGFMTSN
ncbi:MAG: transposase [Desulfovibrio sp.]|nr:transposase [Desulfovibrio sp.]